MEPRWKLRRVGILSAVRIGGLVGCALGFVFGAFWGLVLALFTSVLSTLLDMPVPGFGAVAVFALPIFLTVFYGVAGTVLSFVLALFYNILAGLVGGLEFEMGFERRDDIHPII